MLRVEKLSVEKGNFSLRDISFGIKPGECFVVLGATGAGKTMLLETIAGLNRASAGEVYINSANVTNLKPEHRNIAYVPQDYAIFPHLKVKDNITIACRVRKMPKGEIAERYERLVDLLQIGHILDRYPRNLSGGEQQRVALARALIIHPTILLMDEPLSALDAQTRNSVRGELKDILKRLGITSIIVTHDHVDALTFGDDICIIDKGRIAQIGPREQILAQPRSKFVADFLDVNFLEGQAEPYRKESSLRAITASGARLLACTDCDCDSPVLGSFFPADVALSDSEPQADPDHPTNLLVGRIKEIAHLGDRMRVVVDAEIPIVAKIPAEESAKLDLARGKKIYASVAPTAIRVYSYQQDRKA